MSAVRQASAIPEVDKVVPIPTVVNREKLVPIPMVVNSGTRAKEAVSSPDPETPRKERSSASAERGTIATQVAVTEAETRQSDSGIQDDLRTTEQEQVEEEDEHPGQEMIDLSEQEEEEVEDEDQQGLVEQE